MRIRLRVSYDGTDFCGWQRQQRDDITSVQEVLETALARFFQQKISVSASGRTDAGVHALAQQCHFDLRGQDEKLKTRDLCWALQGILPPSIVVRKAWIAPDDFHSTLSATHKTYKYFLYNHWRANPLLRRTSMWRRYPIDLDHLHATTKLLIGTHDFACFKSQGTDVVRTVRTIHDAKWERTSRNMLRFTITGSGFMKQMVRNIIGTQLKLEKDGKDPSEMGRIIASLDRRQAGAPAQPQGLYLWRVYYPSELEARCQVISDSRPPPDLTRN